ncbi:energy-coupling factor transporter transmembrane component T family protein [Aerococcus urinae]|uniref:Energy-coupling factor transporter transmembrane protein EcfT n=1 Tax=Aerococcus urinae TaxID=1376 RepID=A0A0X8FCZ0_9LACT|nr:energy-coupling factor transporter transmembrane component T [Aerococcus urinae]AMB95060.1 cobalt transporter [Aerococcus urinae]MCY3031770.1 energy-coupling factor transporter transmembrane protein EcfT [Aerococcus urinae]MCY3043817.1 energy-coupling factor transporter transmembrane protein EcfT [Aerococcus urinae]MCY3046538.1 energy-coupling factor transporter transmembrane protein EcfT [Aerococcus urinae]MCY3047271.1 energy-coupling factor transporter transmembrane protein EcfT [Aerococc
MHEQLIIRYDIGDGYFDRLAGSTKLWVFVTALALMMVSFDLRIILPLFLIHAWIFKQVYRESKALKFIFRFMLIMNLINVLLYYLANPLTGTELAGQITILYRFNDYFVVTYETLVYFLARIMKMIGSLIISLCFILTITPTQLASGLYAMGVPYQVGTMFSLGLRYMPDIFRDFTAIKESMQMRGLELNPKRAGIFKRLKANTAILLPLIIVSFDQVETISSAMDLRGYGQGKKRTYYGDLEPGDHDKQMRLLAIVQGGIFVIYMWLRLTGRVHELWVI